MEKTMSQGLLGRKVGMMRIFTDDGDTIPVTVLDVSNNRVTQIKTDETDGYTSVQVTSQKQVLKLVLSSKNSVSMQPRLPS
jgi:large subunit ribosomal protein L3